MSEEAEDVIAVSTDSDATNGSMLDMFDADETSNHAEAIEIIRLDDDAGRNRSPQHMVRLELNPDLISASSSHSSFYPESENERRRTPPLSEGRPNSDLSRSPSRPPENADRTILDLVSGRNSFSYSSNTSPVLQTRLRTLQRLRGRISIISSDSDSDFEVVTRNPPPAVEPPEILLASTLSQEKKRKISSPEENSPKKMRNEEEGMTCPICFEFWTNNGEHRLVSLKCGHLFGKNCVERWLKDCQKKCPQCNSAAKKADVRVIYANNLKAIDNTELEQSLREVQKLKAQNQDKDIEIANIQMQYQIALNECSRLKSEVSTFKANQHASRINQTLSSQASVRENLSESSLNDICYSLCGSNTVSTAGGCRFMDFDRLAGNFVISQQSPFRNQILSGFGVKKLSADLRSGYFTPLHQKAIKDLKFSPLLPDRLLSASQDGSLRITDLANNSKIHEYKVGKPVWSCCWDSNDSNIIYAGLNNGSFVQYDLRNTSDLLSTIVSSTLMCPVVSLYHVPPTATDFFQGRGGLVCATLDGASMWQDMAPPESGTPLIESFKPTLFPLEQRNCTGMKYCHNTQCCLFSFRPGRRYPTTTHHLCQLSCKSSAGSNSQVGCEFINTYFGGRSHKMLTRNALFVLPDKLKNKQNDRLLACVGNESTKNVQIYDASNGNGNLLQSFPSDNGTCLDITPVPIQSNDYPMLATLSESSLQLFKIKSS